MKYAIYGAGSLGTVLGAYLSRDGVEIQLVNRNRDQVEALNRDGARITGTVEMTVPVSAILPGEMTGPYDVVFLMTKQLRNEETAAFLKPLLAPEGVVVTLQNGIPEPGLIDVLGKEHVMGCTVEWGATLAEPGHSVLTSDPDSLSFHMGRLPGNTEEQFRLVKELLEHMCPVHEEADLLGARWSKLLINATFSGLGTVIGGVFGDVSEGRDVQDLALACMKECIDVGHAAGQTFAPVQGKDITKLFYYTNPVKKAFARLILPIAMKKHRNIEPSMLQDLKKGKSCEVDAINGMVCRQGRASGVPTPVNDRIVEVIHKEQSGELPLSRKNLEAFRVLR